MRFRLRNREGTPVDPVPFFVVAGLAVMLVLSFGPLYGQAIGVGLEYSAAGSIALSFVFTVGAYYRQVWTVRPEFVGVVPSEMRVERLYYLMLVLLVVVVGLAIPLVR
ncbi:hypothetical protein [Natronosalvus halobius]|uniref:hypothetical protein n=1 Tax=Natronosalvus halobius TaxID=2953746 RepID=UPI00209FF724|nr:hypothetical protein [Natronosalvus halobius]USZ71586.1 hypothetical protein NGM15_16220 [Natronosalvus halobius]